LFKQEYFHSVSSRSRDSKQQQLQWYDQTAFYKEKENGTFTDNSKNTVIVLRRDKACIIWDGILAESEHSYILVYRRNAQKVDATSIMS